MKIHYTKMRLVLTSLFMTLAMGLFAQTTCPALKTYTQGGWGAAPSGNNVGTFLDQNFAANFPAPTYLTIGCTNKLQLTSAAAVRAFLPNGTTPYVLPAGTKVNPTKTNFSNVFAGQLVALALNLRFDNNIASFAPATVKLKDQIIATGKFKGKTVQFLFDNANLIIGGCAGYFSATLSEYTSAIDMVNRNNDNGGINLLSYLVCPIKATCSTTDILCKGGSTGSMSVSVSGGLSPFSYSWTVPSGYSAIGNVASASGLKAGSYSVTVTDALGQSSTTSCSVTEPATAVSGSTVASNVSCNGGNNGSITLTFGGGTGAIMVSFNGGSFAAATSPATYSNLTAGSYSWSVKDANGCTASGSEVVTQPTAVNLTAQGTNPLCSTGSGSITFGATGGTGAFSYTVNGVAATSPYTAAASGDYTIVATDANGCPKSTTVTIAIPSAVVLSANGTNPLCSTGSGSIIFGATGGTGAFSYTVNGAAATSPYTAAASGDYTIVATDANGCTNSTNVSIAIPSELTVSLDVSINCSQPCSNSAVATATGGTSPYSYVWTVNSNTPETSASGSLSGICLSAVLDLTVNVVVNDANGCSASANFYEVNPCPPTDCNPLKTFTQGGWGAEPAGNNPGVYLHANFDAAFPSGVTLGCTNTMSWTSAQAITDWLPSGTTADALPEGNIVNPSGDYSNVLVAQLLAATLNVGFDAYDADFSANDGSLGGRYFADGAFAGMTVNDVIQWANDAVGGCDMHGHTFAEFNAALTDVNENYDNGTQDLGHLVCTASTGKGMTAVANTINTKVFPNPARTEANVTFDGKIGQIATIAVYDLSGRMLLTQKMPTKNGLNQFRLNVSRMVNQTYAVRVIVGGKSTTSMVVVQH